ncbi:hypothetical protein NHQ30_001630 [Ciborinia camelliae]|nr:hypothetical protein NHQ30_001630 [Ciborinia camelliae]
MSTAESTNPRTTLHPALIRQPPATYNNTMNMNPAMKWGPDQDFEMREPSPHAQMSMSLTPSTPHSRSSSVGSLSGYRDQNQNQNARGKNEGSAPVHQSTNRDRDAVHQRGGGSGGLCCGICAGLACFECLECCC